MGWTPPDLSASSCQLASCGVGCQRNQGEPDINTTAALPIVGVDLANSVLQLAVADGSWRVVESHRLTRGQFELGQTQNGLNEFRLFVTVALCARGREVALDPVVLLDKETVCSQGVAEAHERLEL